MGKFVLIIVLIVALVFAYLLIAYVADWWPFNDKNDKDNNSDSSPKPSVSGNGLPTSIPVDSIKPTPTPPLNSYRVDDTAGNYSFYIPNDWEITKTENKRTDQLSYIELESRNYYGSSYIGSEGYKIVNYEQGAKLLVHEVTGLYNSTHESAVTVYETRQPYIDGVWGVFHNYNHPTVGGGKLLDLHLRQGGRTYLLTFAYNPDTYPNGELIFEDIFNSFWLTDNSNATYLPDRSSL